MKVFVDPVKSDNQRKITEKFSIIANLLAEISTLAFADPETAWFYRISENLWEQVRWTAIDFGSHEMFVMAAFRKCAETAEEMSA